MSYLGFDNVLSKKPDRIKVYLSSERRRDNCFKAPNPWDQRKRPHRRVVHKEDIDDITLYRAHRSIGEIAYVRYPMIQ